MMIIKVIEQVALQHLGRRNDWLERGGLQNQLMNPESVLGIKFLKLCDPTAFVTGEETQLRS